jgi:trimethylamine--corrinoid protein Co-methyltransferase
MTRERHGRRGHRVPERAVDYVHLRNPFRPQAIFSDDEVAGLHAAALDVLERLGMRILLPEARTLLRGAGALVDEAAETVRIGREIVEAALAAAPRQVRLRAANPGRERDYAEGEILFSAGAGCPNACDATRGRRPGTLADFEEALILQQSFDAIHKHGPSVEPQDVPAHLRHYAMMRGQMVLGDKPMFVYARGRRQVAECFEMIRLGLDLSEEDWGRGAWASTVINTNSPRQLDVPMAEGVIDFARAGQLSVITPFCLMGAMAPVTVGGALVLQHAEALACIALAQTARPGAPVSYGGFGSNVDMRSGAPAFGTAEHVRMQLGTGQLARLIGLPFRSAAGSAGNLADAQGAGENLMGLWGAMLSGATLCIHAAGWLEGGLSFGYEKFVTDMEAVETLAELCQPLAADSAMEAIAEVAPGGHFFAAAHTMARYATAFRAPLVADLSNHGAWAEAGGLSAAHRATAEWRRRLAETPRPAQSAAAAERLGAYIAARSAAGGAPPSG